MIRYLHLHASSAGHDATLQLMRSIPSGRMSGMSERLASELHEAFGWSIDAWLALLRSRQEYPTTTTIASSSTTSSSGKGRAADGGIAWAELPSRDLGFFVTIFPPMNHLVAHTIDKLGPACNLGCSPWFTHVTGWTSERMRTSNVAGFLHIINFTQLPEFLAAVICGARNYIAHLSAGQQQQQPVLRRDNFVRRIAEFENVHFMTSTGGVLALPAVVWVVFSLSGIPLQIIIAISDMSRTH